MTKKELIKKLENISDDTNIEINQFHKILYSGMQQTHVNGRLTTSFILCDDLDYCFEDKPIKTSEV